MRANWLCGRFCVQASSFENYIAEKPFTDRFVQQSRSVITILMFLISGMMIFSHMQVIDKPPNFIALNTDN
jgi:hypothetical protein